MCKHYRNLTQNNTLIGRHFNEEGHHVRLEDLALFVLQFAKGHPDSDTAMALRIQLEQNLISRLISKNPDGLNLLITKTRHNVNLRVPLHYRRKGWCFIR